MSYFTSLLVDGLSAGCVYALIALGFAIVYGVLKLLNFAHSEVFTAGTFIAYFVFQGMARWAAPSLLVVALAMLAAGTGAGLLSVLLERVAYRPLRQAPPINVLLTAIGISILLQAVGMQVFGAHTRGFPAVAVPLGPRWFAVAVLLLSFAALLAFVHRSAIGLRVRAVSELPRTALLMGIDPDRTIMIAFFVGGFFAGIAGVVWGVVYGTVAPQMGFLPALKSFMIAALGSIGRLDGTFVIGVTLGVVESLVSGYLPSDLSSLRDPAVFLILLIALVMRPAGLFGQRQIAKV